MKQPDNIKRAINRAASLSANIKQVTTIFANFTIVKNQILRIFAKLKTCKCKQQFIPLYKNRTTMKPFITFSTPRSLTLNYMIYHQRNSCQIAHYLHTAGVDFVQNAHFLHTEKF